MSIKHNQSGFGHIAIPVMIVALLVIGFSGYTVWHRQHTTTNDSSNNSSTTTAAVTIPVKITSKADLHQAAQALSNANTQMQSQLNSSALDSSINRML